MPANWEKFAGLPGAATTNFEFLCRSLIRRHYGQFGHLRGLANQPGVEFHLKLHSECDLGKPARHYGWQCRWYGIQPGTAIGATRRSKIKDALNKTREALPGLTDWVLWTRHPLTEGDQSWFYGLGTDFDLSLKTGADVEDLLAGPGAILRSTYFGELVLTPDELALRQEAAAARVKGRWIREVHQPLDAERRLGRALIEPESWGGLLSIAARIHEGVLVLEGQGLDDLTSASARIGGLLDELHAVLKAGDYERLAEVVADREPTSKAWRGHLRRLRAGRSPSAPFANNLLADVMLANDALARLAIAIEARCVALVGKAGFGKTELAVQLTTPAERRPPGILLHGRDLSKGRGLDDLARTFLIEGTPVPSFDALLTAVDAAGQRAGRRIPVFIDGLNEAEDPRDWKGALASIEVSLRRTSYVLLICTLRSSFRADALPEDWRAIPLVGFQEDAAAARRRYFEFYRIDATDALLPMDLLNHPLALRMFCEVANPHRKTLVGVEAIPSSLTGLFDRYLTQVAGRVAELAPTTARYYEADVADALGKIGSALWVRNARSIELNELRKLLGDETRYWDASLVRALESEGILIRVRGSQPSAGEVALVYDALAGHIVADALIDEHDGAAFEPWFVDCEARGVWGAEPSARHVLAEDVLGALVHLSPRRRHRKQLWPLFSAARQQPALLEAAWLEAQYIDSETVTALRAFVGQGSIAGRDLLMRLLTTRAARHPLDARFLDEALREQSVRERDLRWSEWLRRNGSEILADIQGLESRWKEPITSAPQERLRAMWVMWTLTSSIRRLRDHATRALYWLGCSNPKMLFDLTIESLSINDPYVPERMLAASYGVAMSTWCDPAAEELRRAMPHFAAMLVEQMFLPSAPFQTHHALMVDSALGVIELATRLAPGCIPDDQRAFLQAPFAHIPSEMDAPLEGEPGAPTAATSAIHMDFGNYTVGRLVDDRRNYDDTNPIYRVVRGAIERRILQLGYSSDVEAVDRRQRDEAHYQPLGKVDRYGKKYSWIAYFEMYGLRHSRGQIREWRATERVTDVDLDPSFPEEPAPWRCQFFDAFSAAPTDCYEWLERGTTPSYDHLLRVDVIDDEPGPWLLLDGFIEEVAPNASRSVFTFLRGVFAAPSKVERLRSLYDATPYPGDDAIPEAMDDHYTYGGEIPWSRRFGSALRDEQGRPLRDQRDAFERYGDRKHAGIPVEVPSFGFAWESYHSELNKAGNVAMPAPAICDRLGLRKRRGWDLYDAAGRKAALFRGDSAEAGRKSTHAVYLRSDLVDRYLSETRQRLLWFLWGERQCPDRSHHGSTPRMEEIYAKHLFIHKYSAVWSGQAAKPGPLPKESARLNARVASSPDATRQASKQQPARADGSPKSVHGKKAKRRTASPRPPHNTKAKRKAASVKPRQDRKADPKATARKSPQTKTTKRNAALPKPPKASKQKGKAGAPKP